MSENNSSDAASSASTANRILQSSWAQQVDGQTAQQFTGLARVRQARANQLQRVAAALAKQYGGNDPGVQAAQAALKNEQIYASRLGIARDTSSATVPAAPAGGWVLYGHLRNADLTPAAHYTVFLADQRRAWLAQYGYAFTDLNGYYTLTYTPQARTKANQQSAAALSAIYIAVSDQECKLVYFDENPTTLNAGAVVNRDIVLGQGPIGTPPCQEGAPAATPPGKK